MWNIKNFPPVTYEISERTPLRLNGNISIGGFFLEFASSEIILASSDLKTDNGEYNYFLCGWITQTILSPISYIILDHANPDFYGDLRNIEICGGKKLGKQNRRGVEIFIVGHALMNLSRLIFRLQSSPVEINSTPTSVTVSLKF